MVSRATGCSFEKECSSATQQRVNEGRTSSSSSISSSTGAFFFFGAAFFFSGLANSADGVYLRLRGADCQGWRALAACARTYVGDFMGARKGLRSYSSCISQYCSRWACIVHRCSSGHDDK